jgi:hypothetical protein
MSGRKTFVGGDILLASEINTFLQDQAVMVFDDAADRTTAIPSPSEGMVTYLKDVNSLQQWTGAAWVSVVSGFTASQTITATDEAWAVPTLGNPIVKVTVIGAGGGGGGGLGDENSPIAGNGGNGGPSTFGVGEAFALTGSGGLGGAGGARNVAGQTATPGSAAGNNGYGGQCNNNSEARGPGTDGAGGSVVTSYINLTGVSTVDVVIGAGGAAGTAGFNASAGSVGGRGEVVVEYVAG